MAAAQGYSEAERYPFLHNFEEDEEGLKISSESFELFLSLIDSRIAESTLKEK